MTTKKLTKLLALYLPYLLLGLVATNLGEAWRLAEGKELGDKIMSMMGTIPVAFANPLPSLHPLDLLVGLCCGAGLRLAVYLRGKNAKKYRHGILKVHESNLKITMCIVWQYLMMNYIVCLWKSSKVMTITKDCTLLIV